MKKAVAVLVTVILCLNFGALEAFSRHANKAARAAKPDLQLVDIVYGGSTSVVTFKVISHGYTVPAKSIDVLIIANKKDGMTAWSHVAPVEQEIPADKVTEIKIKLPADKSLMDKDYQVVIDGSGKLAESNESNNGSKVVSGPQNFPSTTSLDLKFRPALYFTPFQSGSKERMGTPSQPLKIKRAEVSNCASDQCGVALKVFVMKAGEGKSAPVVRISNLTNSQTNSGTVVLEATQQAKEFTMGITLNVGENKLRLELDTNKQYQEASESNNSIEITVVLGD